MKNIREDQQGFNLVYMMLDSGARFQRTNSSTGMRGLMAASKNRLLVVVKLLKIQFFLTLKKVFLFLRVLYFLNHGARKGLADTALKRPMQDI
jgi:DNA-directed RNA polymerase subunit beta'